MNLLGMCIFVPELHCEMELSFFSFRIFTGVSETLKCYSLEMPFMSISNNHFQPTESTLLQTVLEPLGECQPLLKKLK